MKNVFVTGSTGFVGRHVVRRLAELGCSVRCMVRPSSDRSVLAGTGAEFCEGSFDSPSFLDRAVEGVDTVIHIAGLTRARRRGEYFTVNQLACRALGEALLRAGGAPTVVSISSLAAAGAGWKTRRADRARLGRFLPREEQHQARPVSPYGKSKYAGEQEWVRFADRLPITIVRPAIIFGEEDRLSLPLFDMALNYPFFLLPGYHDYPFSFIYIQDLVELIIAAAQRGERLEPDSLTAAADDEKSFPRRCSGRGIYFGTHPETPLYSEFGRMLYEAVGRSPYRFVHCPPLGLLGAGAVMELAKRLGAHPPMDWDKSVESLGGPWFCVDRKSSRIGVTFSGTLQEELTATAAWGLENGWLTRRRKG